MSLPLPYRPKAVQELIEEEKRASLKMTIKKKDFFLSAMMAWYRNLSKKSKAELTKKKLQHRALVEAFRLKLPYDHLPPDWVHQMVQECGLVCYISKSAMLRRRARAEERLFKEPEFENLLKPEPQPGQFKKFIDLTYEEPPEEWTKSMRKGIPTPRYLALASDTNSNIVYWDYDPTHWKVDGGVENFTSDPNKSPTRDVRYNKFH